MSAPRSDRKAFTTLSTLIVIGASLLTIPFFLTPPAYLDLALRDVAFGADLSKQRIVVTDDSTGKSLTAPIQRIGNTFVARIGRINSGKSVYTAQVTGYKPGSARVDAAALQNVRVPVDLTPTFGRLEITTYNAMRSEEPLDATVKDGGRPLSAQPQSVVTVDLPPGSHRLAAEANGFCPSERSFDVQAGKITKAAFPLAPDLQGDEAVRFVLGWRNEPRDLDSHFWRLETRRFPSDDTVYFGHKVGTLSNGNTFARLDVDVLFPGRYETLTVRKDAIGEYRYFIHAYQGSGTIGDAEATVQVYTRGCRVRTLTPPADCGHRIWNVMKVTNGELSELQRCEPEGTVAVRK